MQKLTTLIAVAFVAALASCTNGLNQDPYANQPSEVRNAEPLSKPTPEPTATPAPTPEPDKKAGDALSSQYLRIESADNIEFREGVEAKATIKGAILAEINGHEAEIGKDFDLTIDNMSDFPGASYDAPSGEFKWTPSPGFVSKEYTRNVHLEATLTTKTTPTILRTQKSILGIVTRSEIDPTIVSVDDLTSKPVREGDVREFKVVVRDPHGDATSADTKPRLTIVSTGTSTSSVANLISCAGFKGCTDPSTDATDPHLFTFKLRMDLTGKEVVLNRQTMQFGLMATSRFGESSAVQSTNVVVDTLLQEPQVSLNSSDTVQLVAGRENLVNFTVIDPTTDGKLNINFDTSCALVLGNTATCSCAPIRVGSPGQLCTVYWSVPQKTLQTDFKVAFTAHTETRDGSQFKNWPTTITLHVVQPAGGTPPTPLPGPTPRPLTHNQPNTNGGRN